MSYIGKQPTKAPLTASDIEDGIITAAKIEDGAVVAAEIASNAVTTAKINADAVTGAKIADDAINSEHYTDGSVDTAHIADANVTTAKIADDAITAAKINNDIISGTTALASAPADTDEFLVSDAGTLKRIDYSLIKGGTSSVYFQAQKTSDQTISNASSTKLTWDSAVTESSSAFDFTNNKFTATVAGRYLFAVRVGFYDSDNNLKRATVYNYKNNSGYRTTDFFMADGGIRNAMVYDTWVEDVAVNDYFEVYVLQNTTDSGTMTVEGGSNFQTTFSGFILA